MKALIILLLIGTLILSGCIVINETANNTLIYGDFDALCKKISYDADEYNYTVNCFELPIKHLSRETVIIIQEAGIFHDFEAMCNTCFEVLK